MALKKSDRQSFKNMFEYTIRLAIKKGGRELRMYYLGRAESYLDVLANEGMTNKATVDDYRKDFMNAYDKLFPRGRGM